MFLAGPFVCGPARTLFFYLGLSGVGEFAFVLFAFSRQKGILTDDTIRLMIAVVAMSMALTPLLFLLNEKLIQTRFSPENNREDMEPDVIEEQNPVIIAGFGHFGNTTGRFLRAHRIGTTVLDNDS